MKILCRAIPVYPDKVITEYTPESGKDNGFVYGYYVFARNHHYILEEYNDAGYDERWETAEWVIINILTLGLFTGLTDKNGKPCYAGDIVQTDIGKGKVIFHAGCFFIEWIDDPEADMNPLGFDCKKRRKLDFVITGYAY